MSFWLGLCFYFILIFDHCLCFYAIFYVLRVKKKKKLVTVLSHDNSYILGNRHNTIIVIRPVLKFFLSIAPSFSICSQLLRVLNKIFYFME